MFAKFLKLSSNQFLKNYFLHRILVQKVKIRFCSSSKFFTNLKPDVKDMDSKSIDGNDINDESVIPPNLMSGQSIGKFHQYMNAKKFERKPKFESYFVDSFWVSRVHLSEPKEIIFCGKSKRKRTSLAIAAAKGLLYLRANKILDNNYNSILSTPKQRQEIYDSMRTPIDINPIDSHLKENMKSFVNDFDEKLKESVLNVCRDFDEKCLNIDSDYLDSDKELIDSLSNTSDCLKYVRNVINSKVYEEPNDYVLNEREETLKQFIEQRKQKLKVNQKFAKLRESVGQLPIARFKQQILEAVQQNRVLVISGDTGCGKTTQLPQYIFENEISEERGAFTNIVVTQPRRISTISISERIAQEFGEEVVGNSIGYHVRFDKIIPKHETGNILFCSAGILLRKLESNPSLKGVSHVIIDEVHERDVIIDFLLVLLKRVLFLNPNIRIILMSASMNANLFVEYFSCPLIEIPGRCYPVRHFYLEDFAQKIGANLSEKNVPKNPKIDGNLISNLINYIDRNKSNGAVLCFLPGWAEIQMVSNFLSNQNSNNLLVIPVHSKLPHSMQKLIFSKPPLGVRKVVLATNIAETSLTIDDVVYVIDSGLAKEMRYNPLLNVSNFGTNWISKANAKQRSGRAGRVKEGECYRLYTKEIENTLMNDFPIPELLRIPLENVVMQTKLHCPQEVVQQFLSEVPQPPTTEAINSALKSLKEIKVLDENENLTNLGKRIVSFTTHPRLSVALVYSAMFGCLRSVVRLVSQLSENREPFHVMPDQRSLIRQIKKDFSMDMLSDHISLIHMTTQYEDSPLRERHEFCENYHLSDYAMKNITETQKIFASHLEESELIPQYCWDDYKSDVNINWFRKQLIIGSLIPSFVPNFVRFMRGDIKKRKINDNQLFAFDVNTGRKVRFVSESVFQDINCEDFEKLSKNIIIYFGSFFSEDSRMLTLCDASIVSPLSLILFSGNKFEFDFSYNSQNTDKSVVILRNNTYLRFNVNSEDLQLIDRWISIFTLFRKWFLIPKTITETDSKENDLIINYLREFMELTDELLRDDSL